jgi:hypothetical protein
MSNNQNAKHRSTTTYILDGTNVIYDRDLATALPILLEISLTFLQDLVYMFRVYPIEILRIRECVFHQLMS